MGLGKCAQSIDHRGQGPGNLIQAISQHDGFRVAVEELTGRPKVQDGSGVRGHIAPSVDVGHDIVPQLGLVGRGFVKIDVIEGALQLFNLLRGDRQTQFVLGFGQSEPQSTPQSDAVSVRKEGSHFH